MVFSFTRFFYLEKIAVHPNCFDIICFMSEQKAKFLPFHALNEFMVPEYRLAILTHVYSQWDQIRPEARTHLLGYVKRMVKVTGFRNPTVAPAALKARASVSSFERSPEFTAAVLSAWASLYPDLAKRVFDLLTQRGWELLPVDADRTRLPGFLTRWPAKEDYDTLGEAYQTAYPDAADDENDLRLMVVWLGMRLPLDMVDSETEEEDSTSEG